MTQREKDDYLERANRRADLHTQGVKGLFILEGGGIIALLSLMGQLLVTDREYTDLIRDLVIGATLYCFGLIFLVPIPHLRYETSKLYDKEETKSKGIKYSRIHKLLFYLSMIAFGIGTLIVLIGFYTQV